MAGRENIDRLRDAIEDIGYGAEIVTAVEDVADTPNNTERIVEFSIEGMHCESCPDRIVAALETSTTDQATDTSTTQVLQHPSLRAPVIKVGYVPNTTQDSHIRRIKSAILAVDSAFSVSVYHPPTIEERSRHLQQAERTSILRRLLCTGVVAIPTFIIGIVFMSLVSKENATRKWFEEPIWGGNAARLEWALFITTTPVMLYGADAFHRRALKEIWTMWKPGSKCPYLRRFYRFGSMNLLISAATMVAYIASFAVLIVNAVQPPMQHDTMSNTYFDAVVFLTFFILVGRYLEAYSKAKTSDAVTMLGQLRPREVSLVTADRNSPENIPIDELELNDHVLVQRGQSPPADGTVAEQGTFSFDESSLTGESKPVTKALGDIVYAGTVNVDNPVEVTVTKIGGTTMLDNIISVVREGQAKRAPIERFADVLTSYFVPVITLLAIITWLIWLAFGLSGRLPRAWLDGKQGGWAFWSLEFAIAVFVIACPCGIGLAAPTALFVGGGLAAKKGILVQGGGQAFQEASHIDAVVFDKTGTLTQGEMRVVECSDHSNIMDRPTAVAIARALEQHSTHPIAQAIVAHIEEHDISVSLDQITEIPGQGMRARVTIHRATGDEILEAAIGSEALIDKLFEHDDEYEKLYANTATSDSEHTSTNTALYLMRYSIQEHQVKGHSIAILAIRKPTTVTNRFCPVLLFAIADPLRPEAPAVVSVLQSRGIAVHMCTGDNPLTALVIASQLGIPVANVRTSAMPQDKAAYVHALQHSHDAIFTAAAPQVTPIYNSAEDSHTTYNPTTPTPRKTRQIIAFAGDGINDTPALTAADVSISLASGSDVAVHSASFILLSSNLTLIPELLDLSRRVFLRVEMNFVWAVVYNVVLIPVAAGAFFWIGMTNEKEGFRLGPVWAAVAMAGSSVSVVLSSLALRLPEVRFGGPGMKFWARDSWKGKAEGRGERGKRLGRWTWKHLRKTREGSAV